MFEREDAYVLMDDVTFRARCGHVFAHTTWLMTSKERWAIRGASGAGKSLFVQALTGRLPRVNGTMRHPFLEGSPQGTDSVYGVLPPGTIAISSMEEHKTILAAREFHQIRWHGSLSSGAVLVKEFLSYVSVINRNPFVVRERDEAPVARFDEVYRREVARWELESLLERPVLALSNGELHRTLIARALMLEPRLLIVDEPYSGLDSHTRLRLVENLETLVATGTGVLYVVARAEDLPASITHELEVAQCSVVYAGPRRRSTMSTVIAPTPSANVEPLSIQQRERSSEAVLELRDVTVKQGEVTLLDHVSLTLLEHERCALVGPNGSGKSTLLSLVLADNPQVYRNHVVVGGAHLRPGTSIWDIKRHVGWVSPELDAHYPAATPLIDVVMSGFRSSLGLYERNDVAERQNADAWLRRLGLVDFATKVLGDVCRLEQRLTFLARACVHQPKLLLLDEPCQGFDAADRGHFTVALERCLVAFRPALIYVTHEPAELPKSIERLLRLNAGRIVENAAVESS